MQTQKHSSWKTLGLTAASVLLLAASVPGAMAQSGSRPVALTPGTVIPVILNSELSSNNSQNGDTFTARVDSSRQAYNAILQGASVDGIVHQATAQSGKDPGTLDLSFTRLHLSDGRTFQLSGTLTSLNAKDLETRSDGVLVAKTTKKDNRLTYAGIGAGAGVLAGVLSGGKIKIEDILIGGGLGYAAAALLKGNEQVHDVDLKPGTQMGVLVNNNISYYHRTTVKAVKRAKHTTHRYHYAY